jgi:DNA-binding MarR family transcriptional regulator
MISSGGMTGRLDRLERAGLVAPDRRGAQPPHRQRERLLLSLTEAEQQTLSALLQKLIAGL